MSDSGGTIDLLNVDYEDVLHLYRGWRHAESQLKEKNKELTTLKNRIKQLQDSHAKFRGQIQALESVKELTVTLKTQLAALEEENKQLVIENSTLSEVNNQAEELLIEGETTTHKLSSQLNKHSLEAAEYKGRCSQLLESQSELEKLLTEEQAARLAAENRSRSLEQTIEKLNQENRDYKWKLESSYSKMGEYNREIESASSHLAHLTHEISDMSSLKEQVSLLETEKTILKRDIIRLLRLLEHYPAGKGFLKQWQDSEGMSFVGTHSYRGGGEDRERGERYPTGEYDLTYSGSGGDSGGGYDHEIHPVTPQELAQFKRVHQVEHDTNVMFPTMEEELEHWTPHTSIVQGYQYLNSKLPVAPLEVLQTFLRRMNKIWVRREKRKIQRVKENYEHKIADLKRQLSNARPYHGVMAERKIRCLNHQVKAIRCKSLNCKPKQWNEFDSDDDDTYHLSSVSLSESRGRGRSTRASTMDLLAAEKGWVSPLTKTSAKRSSSQPPPQLQSQSPQQPLVCSRCRSRERGGAGGAALRGTVDDNSYFFAQHSSPATNTKRGGATGGRKGTKESLDRMAAKELLGASLHSLEQLQRQRERGRGEGQESLLEDSYGYGSGFDGMDMGIPSAEYLKGAIWLGRNLHMVTEDLVEQLDFFRTKYLREVSALSRTATGSSTSTGAMTGTGIGDPGAGAGVGTSHRLSLLAASGITDAMTIAYAARTKSRQMLQQASGLSPGDREAMQRFLMDLPIERSLLSNRA